jgi:hypothetical protein
MLKNSAAAVASGYDLEDIGRRNKGTRRRNRSAENLLMQQQMPSCGTKACAVARAQTHYRLETAMIHCNDAPTIRADVEMIKHQKKRKKRGAAAKEEVVLPPAVQELVPVDQVPQPLPDSEETASVHDSEVANDRKASITTVIDTTKEGSADSTSRRPSREEQEIESDARLLAAKDEADSVAEVVRNRRRSRQKSLPGSVSLNLEDIEWVREPPRRKMSEAPPRPQPQPRTPSSRATPTPPPPPSKPKPKPKPRSQHKRKNSYRAAQEKGPIDEFWYIDRDRERTKSSGNLFEEERWEKREKNSLRPRNSSSMGNILDKSSDIEYTPLRQQQQPRLPAVLTETTLGRTGGAAEDRSPQKPNKSSASGGVKRKLRSSYHYERHPLSHSTTILLEDSTPIVPNRSPATPDVWVARTIKA